MTDVPTIWNVRPTRHVDHLIAKATRVFALKATLLLTTKNHV